MEDALLNNINKLKRVMVGNFQCSVLFDALMMLQKFPSYKASEIREGENECADLVASI